MKAARPVIASNGVPSLQMRSEGSHSTSGREEEIKKDGWGVDRQGKERKMDMFPNLRNYGRTMGYIVHLRHFH